MSDPLPRTILVDLTPLLPGGDNGGAKIVTLGLLRALARLAPDVHFILLTETSSHEELAWMEGSNVSRRLVAGAAHAGLLRAPMQTLGRHLLPLLPAPLARLAGQAGYRLHGLLRKGFGKAGPVEPAADLLFCPFTAPTFHNPGRPTVSIVYDLQFNALPGFFTADDRANREWSLREAGRLASALVAISDHTRQAAIAAGFVPADKITTIHPRLAHRMGGEGQRAQGERSVQPPVAGPYLVYPANFWPHKNHEMLLTALGMACHQGLPREVRLVCTGSPGARGQALAAAAKDMGLGERVLFPGFLPDADLTALLAGALGVVFPSLHEGFGLPIIEAMAMGIPVACSQIGALPEIAGDAALYFDPRVPAQIADALRRLSLDTDLRARLSAAGRSKSTGFADTRRMAEEFWAVFESVLVRAPGTRATARRPGVGH